MLDVCKWYPIMYDESQNTVLQQECMRYNKLLAQIKSTLIDVRKALKVSAQRSACTLRRQANWHCQLSYMCKQLMYWRVCDTYARAHTHTWTQGLVVMSAELDALATSVYNNQVPGVWEAKSYPSLKPLVLWQEDLLRRCHFVDDWVQNGIPATFWVSGFFFPQAFLTAILQNFSRKRQIGIDTVSLEMRNQKVANCSDPVSELQRPEDGAIIWGLFLEGCAWSVDEFSLVESRPKELFTPYVPVHLMPIQFRVKPEPAKTYICPCYKILTRKGVLSTTGHSTNFVCEFEVPTAVEPTHWVKRGVALFLALAY
jgi:dynein heavy chain